MEVRVKYISDTDIKLVRPNGELIARLKLQIAVPKERRTSYAHYIEVWLNNAKRVSGKTLNPWQQLAHLNQCMQNYSDFPNSFVRIVTDEKLNREFLGVQLQKLRKDRKISMRALAQMSGIDYGNLSKIENGKVSVGYDVLCRLLQSLDALPEFIPKIALDKDKLND